MIRFSTGLLSVLLMSLVANAAPFGAGAAGVRNSVNTAEQVSLEQIVEHSQSGGKFLLDILDDPESIEEMLKTLPPRPPVLMKASAGDRVHVIVDKAQKGTSPTAQTTKVYKDGQLIHTWLVSTGREQMETTKKGKQYFSRTPTRDEFRIYLRDEHRWSNAWEAPMPFAQFFIGGIAIHATSEVYYPRLGERASGGCIRLTLENAKIFWDLVTEVGEYSTLISVVDCVETPGHRFCQAPQ